MITVFTIARNRNAQVAQAVLGTQEGSIAVTDRWAPMTGSPGPTARSAGVISAAISRR